MNNPFTPGAGLSPPYLAGRDKEKEAMSGVLRDLSGGVPKNIILHGLRGVGKTVLLDEYASICIKNDFLPVTQFQYGEEHSDPEKFFDLFKNSMDEAIKKYSKKERVKDKFQSAASYIKPKTISVSEVTIEPSYGSDSGSPLMNRIIDYMVKKWDVIKNSHHGAILLFDEFHTINGKKDNQSALGNFISAINEVQRNGHKYAAVLSGLPMLTTNIKIARSYSERMFRPLEISNLDVGKAADAIIKPLEKTKWSFSTDLVSAVIKDTDRYPFFIQFFAREIIDKVDKNVIELDDYNSVRGSILEDLGDAFFSQRMASTSLKQREILRIMASIQKKDIKFSDILDVSDMGKGTVANHLKRLIERGFIYKSKHGFYNFTIPLFRTYILDAASSE